MLEGTPDGAGSSGQPGLPSFEVEIDLNEKLLPCPIGAGDCYITPEDYTGGELQKKREP